MLKELELGRELSENEAVIVEGGKKHRRLRIKVSVEIEYETYTDSIK